MKIQFINHASLLLTTNNTNILSDPWYSGSVFNNGWKLMHETSDTKILKLLKNTNYIWISHEHPDHFSVPFFKKFSKEIIKNKIKVLFQVTEDKRVKKFLETLKIKVIELQFNVTNEIERNVNIIIFKFGFYDSAILVKDEKNVFLNLNDCPIGKTDMLKIHKNFPKIDYVSTQFSYAAWKGGKNNKAWRTEAALEKTEIIKNIQTLLKPKNLILFASFSFFSRSSNAYLNDSWNSPTKIIKTLSNSTTRIIVGKPGSFLHNITQEDVKINAKYWDKKHQFIVSKDVPEDVKTFDIEVLEDTCKKSFKRIRKKNNIFLIKLLKFLSFNYIFGSVSFYLMDKKKTIVVDLIDQTIKTKNNVGSDICLLSTDFNFLHAFDYGFDTLTVNGCFEEMKYNGFKKMIMSYSIFSLNNAGLPFGFRIFFNVVIIKKFLELFLKVIKQNKKVF